MKKIDYVLDFCKELGKALIVSGSNIERVDLSIEKICHAYGLHDVTCANLITRISISAKDENKNYAHRQTDVPQQDINLEKLKKLNELSYKVVHETPDVTTLYDLLHGVHTTDFPWWIILLGNLLSMTALARIFMAGFSEIAVVLLNTFLLFGLRRLLDKIKMNKIISNFLLMFAASFVAILMKAIGFIDDIYSVMITNALYMVPGIQMINCARNILCGNELNGVIELLKILLEVLAIVGGLAAAYAILNKFVAYDHIEEYLSKTRGMSFIECLELVILTLLSSTGFGIGFNIHAKDIGFAALGGGLIRIFYICFQLLFPDYKFLYISLAAFFAALYSEILATSKKEPATLYLYPSIIPVIPGDLFYYSALGLIWSESSLFGTNAPNLLLSLVAISVGFVICSTTIHYIRKFKFKKKVAIDEMKN